MKVDPGVCNTFVLSRLAESIWTPPGSWRVGSLWERAGQTLLSNPVGIDLTMSTLAHCLRIARRWWICVLLDFSWGGEVESNVGYFVTGSSFWSKAFYPLYLGKTFLGRALGEHRCLCGESLALPGPEWTWCSVLHSPKQEPPARGRWAFEMSELRGALSVKYTPAFQRQYRKRMWKLPFTMFNWLHGKIIY